MAIRVALHHRTVYRYDREVWLSPHVVRLSPAPHCRTPILSYSLKVTPATHFVNWQQDPYSNRLARLVFPKKSRELGFDVDLVAELTVINPFDFFLEPSAEKFPFEYDHVLKKELTPYFELKPAEVGPRFHELLKQVRRSNLRTIDFMVEVNSRLQHEVKYLIRLEPGIQTPEESLTKRSGSCRDSAWLFVQLLRHMGLAARFVSGYLIQLAPDVKSLDGPSGTEVDFTDLHAWTEVYLPGAGWIGFDPTSGLLAGEGHIPLACTADPVSASPITGFFSPDDSEVVKAEPDAEHVNGKARDNFEFAMRVTRIHEDPRVTKPYSDEQWTAIETLGHQVDADLAANDVRLTMGGEPTFVSIDDMDGPEWNTLAQGPMKRKLAESLLRRLRDRFVQPGSGGFLFHGQGKWYPGESLPRWAFGLYWRKDGFPIWNDPSLVADHAVAYGFNDNQARDFITALADRLGVNRRFAQPGYEDAWYYLWKERRLPGNVDPLDNKLDNAEDRARLAKVFEQGLGKIVGYALPLRREHYTDGSSAWASGAWFFRPERMYLIPGDSPMGFRLPLDSLPWAAASDRPVTVEQDPWEARKPLPKPEDPRDRQRHLPGRVDPMRGGQPRGLMEQVADPVTLARPGVGQPAPWIIRTALCAETRGGTLHVFMPPQRYLEDYLDLVAAVEETAASLKLPLLLEGYPPPHDDRVNVVKVTPDPGVIEVNTVPVGSWDELVKNTTALYEEARLSRLGTEKFMLDGRHTGTGGGNHIVLGGPTPADSPILRRPDLLRSLVSYWHNHPSLSYLFSGLFVGPTSQAPRVDEARNDQVYELELAFRELGFRVQGSGFGQNNLGSSPEPRTPHPEPQPPWLVDRIFRNLLIDATGNTHRAEFCIDKLYPPEAGGARLGLVEMRAFEMPPHARMSLTQHLLLRALIARFWQRPYEAELVRWRTEVHDRFMLPHFVWQDLEDVVTELNAAGYPLKVEWFAPHFEFRFPHYGSIEQRGVALELRQAIEPWHVLGEEPGGGGTVRYVDSSLERVQVLVRGMTDPRHVVACNGRRVPLHPTGVNGQFVAGVRYRAWQPANCLHPTVGSHAPLVFDLVDTWAGRSIGGCTYHVAHPGGRSYEDFPVNAYAAESRRVARFFKMGHTPGPMSIGPETRSREFPFTLDLRFS